MFEKTSAMFIYTVSPVHMGAGTAIGAIDNPIQRERHTQHPMLAGSGLKGALREAWGKNDTADLIFGPDTDNAHEHAGALSIGDGQIVLFPVRSLRQAYVYATCPIALARLARTLKVAGTELPGRPSDPGDDEAKVPTGRKTALAGRGAGRLVLETFSFDVAEDGQTTAVAERISDMLPAGIGDHFKGKVRTDLVVLSDTRFSYFVRNATVIEPHVRIDDATGTADEGGLFYTENVPPESLFVSLLLISGARKPGQNMKAAEIRQRVQERCRSTAPLQIGGDATTGRGHVLVSFANGGDG